MATTVTKKALRLEGMEALTKRLERLRGPALNRITDKMLRTGAGVVRKEAKRKSPKRTGVLQSSIRVSKLKQKFGEVASLKISAKGKKARHSHLVQLGTKDRYRGTTSLRTIRKRSRKTGKERIVSFRKKAKSEKIGYTGKMPANPFFAIALRVANKTAVKKMETRLRGLLRKELKAV